MDLEDGWLSREIVDDEYLRQRWVKEGIELYHHFLQLDPQEQRYSISLANLYLERGRDEKMRLGNYRKAYDILRSATIFAPDKPDAYYHLSFILANESRKWEAVLFYGKEALEKGLEKSKKIKLLCNMALAYARIGYPQKADEYISEAIGLDEDGQHDWFIQLYKDKTKLDVKEPILLRKSEDGREKISHMDSTKMKEDAMEGKCVVLDLTKDEKYFYAIHDTVRLEKKEGEILGYLIDYQGKSCHKNQIEAAVWYDQEVSKTAVRRYIGTLRNKLSRAMNCHRVIIRENILVTTDDGYAWKADFPTYLLR